MRYSLHIFVALLLQTCLLPAQESAPRIDSLEPDTIEAFTPVRLHISGSGFDGQTRVYLQTSVAGRFLPYSPEESTSSSITLELKTGFALKPRQRTLYVADGKGGESNRVVLNIVPKGSLTTEDAEPVADESREPDDAFAPPVLSELQPARVLMAQPFELLCLGEGFQPGARVEVESNVNVGTSKPPEYRLTGFEAEFLAETLLLITFDRGFAPEPRQRKIVVVNSDGGRSQTRTLTIVSPKEK